MPTRSNLIQHASTVEIKVPAAQAVVVTDDTLSVDLSDGRTLSVPLAWFPRLLRASPEERNRWRLIGRGQGRHWMDVDEDISVEDLLAGKPSGESQQSLKRWLATRPLAQPLVQTDPGGSLTT